jgi:hypothetical protein
VQGTKVARVYLPDGGQAAPSADFFARAFWGTGVDVRP